MNKEEITITKEYLVQWLDRPPSNEDLDLCEFLANAVQNRQKYHKQNQELKDRIDKALNEIQIFIEILKEQPNDDNDEYTLARLRGIKNVLKGDKE